jgi:hypothetical protein
MRRRTQKLSVEHIGAILACPHLSGHPLNPEVEPHNLLLGDRVHDPETRFPVFAFRLHQFISRGDTVHATIESERDRYLSLRNQRFVPGDRSRSLFPLAFFRECGQEYYSVWRVTGEGRSHLQPRDLGAARKEERDGITWAMTSGLWGWDARTGVHLRVHRKPVAGRGRLKPPAARGLARVRLKLPHYYVTGAI